MNRLVPLDGNHRQIGFAQPGVVTGSSGILAPRCRRATHVRYRSPQRDRARQWHGHITVMTVPVPESQEVSTSAHRDPHFSTQLGGLTYTLTKEVLPQDSDYSGAMHHGAYVRWMEEARVRHLAALGIDYGKLVDINRMELVITSLSIRYIRAAKHGQPIALTQRYAVEKWSPVRLITETTFVDTSTGATVATSEVTATPLNIDTGKVVRKWPSELTEAILKATNGGFGGEAVEVPSWLSQKKGSA